MKVALAHDHLFQIGGAERVLREMVSVYPQAPLYSLIASRESRAFFEHTQIVTSLIQRLPGGLRFFKWFLPFMPGVWEQFDFAKYDVVLSSCSAFVKGIITRPTTLHVCYCHTPTRYLWSDRVEYVESLRISKAAKFALLSVLSSLRTWDRLAADRVDYFIANSGFVANRIKEYYDRDAVVMYPPVDISSFTPAEKIRDYFLVVSRLRPYKKVDTVIKAFNRLRLPLVIIGGGEEYHRLKALARHNITFLGEVSDSVRNRYLSQCKAFIHPQEEDFGISVVEAMASGRPVIAYRKGGALESITESVSGQFFDEQSWESLAYAVLLFKAHDYDPKRIIESVERFDTKHFRAHLASFVNQKYQERHATRG